MPVFVVFSADMVVVVPLKNLYSAEIIAVRTSHVDSVSQRDPDSCIVGSSASLKTAAVSSAWGKFPQIVCEIGFIIFMFKRPALPGCPLESHYQSIPRVHRA